MELGDDAECGLLHLIVSRMWDAELSKVRLEALNYGILISIFVIVDLNSGLLQTVITFSAMNKWVSAFLF